MKPPSSKAVQALALKKQIAADIVHTMRSDHQHALDV
jgi:hypothetical protein